MSIKDDKFKRALPKEFISLTKNIGKGYGLGLLKPKLFQVRGDRMNLEQSHVVDDAEKTSWFGLPVYDTVLFEPLEYTDDDGNTVSLDVPLTLDIAIIEINQAKNIVKTQRAGKNGTIKEYMGLGDYNINIKGFLVSEVAGAHPDQTTKEFHAFCKAPKEIKVSSNFLSYFDIYTIVVESFNVRQVEGMRNVFEYEITASDETPFEIQYNKEKQIAMF